MVEREPPSPGEHPQPLLDLVSRVQLEPEGGRPGQDHTGVRHQRPFLTIGLLPGHGVYRARRV
jgi:hypothetical protein